ncbi:uncharacterized protein LOC135141143 isoform X1 [Zophobas morio]|uniref:uncharacterized protein LOC135141143 isoform X1 n=1 Tax=Zophobas morio TaxID=2755281 RepID=UPI003082FAE1
MEENLKTLSKGKVIDFSALSSFLLPRSSKKVKIQKHEKSDFYSKSLSNLEFKKGRREVATLGISGFSKKLRKSYNIEKIGKLCGQVDFTIFWSIYVHNNFLKPPTKVKMPIYILNGIRKKQKRKLIKQKEEEQCSNSYIKRKVSLKKKRTVGANFRFKGYNFDSFAGKFYKGTLHINPSLLNNRRKRRTTR